MLLLGCVQGGFLVQITGHFRAIKAECSVQGFSGSCSQVTGHLRAGKTECFGSMVYNGFMVEWSTQGERNCLAGKYEKWGIKMKKVIERDRERRGDVARMDGIVVARQLLV